MVTKQIFQISLHMYILCLYFRQRFSISGLFYKASRDRKRSSIYQQQSSEEGVQDIGMSTSLNSQISLDDAFSSSRMNQSAKGKDYSNILQVILLFLFKMF